MKKNILTLFFIALGLMSILIFFHSTDMLTRYNRSQNLSINCRKLLGNEIDSYELDLSDPKTSEHWKICIARDSHDYFSILNIISIPIATIYLFLSFYIRRFELKLSNKNLLLIFLSPLVLLFIIALGFNVFSLLKNYKNGDVLFDNVSQIVGVINNILLIGIIFVVVIIKIIIRLFKK